MAELPEIVKIAGQMRDTLRGKSIHTVALLQEKCSNVAADEFQKRVAGARVDDTWHKGKWIITKLDNGENILLSLGMGADILYFEREKSEPEKYQIKVLFSDGAGIPSDSAGLVSFAHSDDSWHRASTKDIAIDPFSEEFTLSILRRC